MGGRGVNAICVGPRINFLSFLYIFYVLLYTWFNYRIRFLILEIDLLGRVGFTGGGNVYIMVS
jgi:hypothetical protein